MAVAAGSGEIRAATPVVPAADVPGSLISLGVKNWDDVVNFVKNRPECNIPDLEVLLSGLKDCCVPEHSMNPMRSEKSMELIIDLLLKLWTLEQVVSSEFVMESRVDAIISGYRIKLGASSPSWIAFQNILPELLRPIERMGPLTASTAGSPLSPSSVGVRVSSWFPVRPETDSAPASSPSPT